MVIPKQKTSFSTHSLCIKVHTSRNTHNDNTKPEPADGKCSNCGEAGQFKRRADDNEESLKTRLMEYYKKTSPLIGYYYAKEMLNRIDGLGDIEAVQGDIAAVLNT